MGCNHQSMMTDGTVVGDCCANSRRGDGLKLSPFHPPRIGAIYFASGRRGLRVSHKHSISVVRLHGYATNYTKPKKSAEVQAALRRSGRNPVVGLNSAGLWCSMKPVLDVARSREGYMTPEPRVNCGKDTHGDRESGASQQKQIAMLKIVCASAGGGIASPLRQGTNLPHDESKRGPRGTARVGHDQPSATGRACRMFSNGKPSTK